MKKIISLIDKARQTLKSEGYRVLVKRTNAYIIRHIRREKPINYDAPNKTYMDILFINGCFLPHPSRYRVTHQKEQLLASNVVCNEVFYEDLTLDLLKNYRVFIFFRCPYTDTIGEFIESAKEMNKTVLYDIDDLVIDTKYTDQVKYLKTISEEERKNYNDGVNRMQRTLKLCDAAITTTERLAHELQNYVPEVFINRNTASDRMVELSEKAVYERDILPYIPQNQLNSKDLNKQSKCIRLLRNRENKIRLGYFSGSITHNDDFKMILPVIERIMEEYENVELHIVGELDIPESLILYKNRIITRPFVNWEQLPKLISSVDINLVPLENTIFNEAKSENKWIEAALVKVVTIASNIGAFQRMVEHNMTGLLCNNSEEWYVNLKLLIEDKNKRKLLAEQAYTYVKRKCTTVYTAYPLLKYIKSKMHPNIAFVLPSTQISGGIMVALTHGKILKEYGFDVLFINEDIGQKHLVKDGIEFPVISRCETSIHGSFDKVVATLWSTVTFMTIFPNINQRYYLVQGYETDFSKPGSFFRFQANQTYNIFFQMKYITVSRWCQQWLWDLYEKKSEYAPNGIDIKSYRPHKRDFNGKIRILVEGNCDDSYKNVDESFKIVDRLDKNRFEIWYMSYQGKPKPNYYVDKFLHQVPHDKVAKVYQQCHILIKSSILESFSYPPLEMMATGGYCVVAPNQGNVEYLRDGENCLFYETGSIDNAIKAIELICSDSDLRDKLYDNGIKTAISRDWSIISNDILSLYDVHIRRNL